MAKLKWDTVGERFFETGTDRGVLYVGDDPGVPWSGLVSVQEASTGVTVSPFYIDGVKYLNRASREEFEATITAYTYPDEFAVCDGTALVGNGLFAKQQRRRSFGFSYRTKVGNDLDGEDHGYKIHIVYQAIAEPSGADYKSTGGDSDVLNFSWHLTTKPSLVEGFAPSAHFVIDSRVTPGALLGSIEDILYGSEQNTPRLPTAGELAYLFTSFNNTNFDAGDPLDISYYIYDAGGPTSVNTEIFDGGAP